MRPRQTVRELVPVLTGIEAWVVHRCDQVSLSLDGDPQESYSRKSQLVVDVIELLILEPPKAKLVDRGSGREQRPGEAAVAGANRGIGIVSDTGAVSGGGGGLNPVGREKAEVI